MSLLSTAPDEHRVGPYRLLKELGRGGQATVYLAEDERLSRRVALKVLHPGASGQIASERFRREAGITSRLDHPGICTIYETGEDRGSTWIAMKYVEGESLASKISTARLAPDSTIVTIAETPPRPSESKPAPATQSQSKPDSWNEIRAILEVFEEAARALHVAHEVGVIHRDVKPGNVMVTSTGHAVLLDFGLAHEETSDLPTLTMSGDVMGTPAYMSPEQIAAQRIKLDRRTDVYSLGVSLYECLTLKRPFDAPTREGLYQAILTKSPLDARRLNARIPRDLAVVIDTAIEKDRDRRYQTALLFASDLQRVRLHQPILAKPVGPLVRLVRWTQRNPLVASLVFSLFLVLCAGLAITTVLLKEKTDALHRHDLLLDETRLDYLLEQAAHLWPGKAEAVERLTSWVDRASRLTARVPEHRAALAALSSHAGITAADNDDPTSADRRLGAKRVARLDAFVGSSLSQSVSWRLAIARRTSEAWEVAIESIANRSQCPAYGGLRIVAQEGLFPIGQNPVTQLWEFTSIPTSAIGVDPIPRRLEGGRLELDGQMGLVLVLLPGATFRMGATQNRSSAVLIDDFDPDAFAVEAPVTTVTLDPFFISKYEMTRSQWYRTAGADHLSDDPSRPPASAESLMPAGLISYEDAARLLPSVGLTLPTEARWEYAARAGTRTSRWTGDAVEGLAKAAHFDTTPSESRPAFPSGNDYSQARRRGHGSPDCVLIGSLAPNPFGLHDVLGNVWEWTLDAASYDVTPRPADGLREDERSRRRDATRVYRGGSMADPAIYVRSALRCTAAPGIRYEKLGVRPARNLDP